jgi:hypothetical protein
MEASPVNSVGHFRIRQVLPQKHLPASSQADISPDAAASENGQAPGLPARGYGGTTVV